MNSDWRDAIFAVLLFVGGTFFGGWIMKEDHSPIGIRNFLKRACQPEELSTFNIQCGSNNETPIQQ